MSGRKVVQIAIVPGDNRLHPFIFALCNDGALLHHSLISGGAWAEFPPIPQPTPEATP